MSKENTTNPAIKRITIGPSRIGGQRMPADLPDEYGKYIVSLERAYDKLSAKNKALIEAVEARDKVIEDMDFQSDCSWCEKNSEIRNKHESE